MVNLDSITWGGSGIERCLYEFIIENIPAGSTMVELGGGNVSTRVFSEVYDLYTIEHNAKWINIFPKSTYIYAPIDSSGWYKRSVLDGKLPKNVDFLFVDGPSGSDIEWMRDGLLNHLDLFDGCDKILFHDTFREDDLNLATKVASELSMTMEANTVGDYWAFLTR
jgi:hypothetical protein